MKIGITTAMDKERAQIRALLDCCEERESFGRTFTTGRLGGAETILAASGIGKVNAALGAVDMIRAFAPDVIISSGVAGGIDPTLANVMDVVAGSTFVYHDVDCGEGNVPGQIQGMPPRFEADPRLIAAAKTLVCDTRIVTGQIATGDRFVSKPEDVASIRHQFPEAIAVDMESCAIAQTCWIMGVPFASFRIISDIPGIENHFSQYNDFWQRIADKSFAVTKHILEAIANIAVQ